jgi:hypothetical protein
VVARLLLHHDIASQLRVLYLSLSAMSTVDAALAAPSAAQSSEQIFAQRYTTTEKLLLSQAVHKYGAAKWESISSLLLEHPSIATRTPSEREELFSVKACEEGYVGLMTDIGINVYVSLVPFPLSPYSSPKLCLMEDLADKIDQQKEV